MDHMGASSHGKKYEFEEWKIWLNENWGIKY
jgi:hypothetical protein